MRVARWAGIASLTLAFASNLFAQGNTYVLKAAWLFDAVSGQIATPGTLVISNGKIQSVGSSNAPAGATLIDLGDATLLPGFIDAHTHLSDEFNPDYSARALLSLQQPVSEHAIRATANARKTVLAGFTTVRDLGSSDFIDVGLRNAINAGIVPGPRMLVSVHALGSTGARQFAFGTSAGYSFHFGGLDVGPDAALNYTYLKVNGFNEADPNQTGMELAFGEQLGESLLLKAGGHISYAISTPVAIILPQLNARYIHEFKNDARALQAHFIEDPSVNQPAGPVSSFAVYTDQPDRGYFDYTGGITAQFAFGIAAFVNYSAIAGQTNIRTHEVSFGIRFQHLVF